MTCTYDNWTTIKMRQLYKNKNKIKHAQEFHMLREITSVFLFEFLLSISYFDDCSIAIEENMSKIAFFGSKNHFLVGFFVYWGFQLFCPKRRQTTDINVDSFHCCFWNSKSWDSSCLVPARAFFQYCKFSVNFMNYGEKNSRTMQLRIKELDSVSFSWGWLSFLSNMQNYCSCEGNDPQTSHIVFLSL